MTDLVSLVLFFALLFLIILGFLFQDRINFLRTFLEDPKKKLYKRYKNGEITLEEYQERMAHLEKCG